MSDKPQDWWLALADIDVRKFTFGFGHAEKMQQALREAADLVDKLEAERDRFRQALSNLSFHHAWHQDMGHCICEPHKEARRLLEIK